jgi:putative endonuclease
MEEDAGYYAYILECADGTLYSGWTTDPARRLEQHNQGKGAKYTRSRLPVQLRAVWRYDTQTEAMRNEWKLKKMSRAQKLCLIRQASIAEGFVSE